MSSAGHFQDAFFGSPESSLLEIHRSKISLHHAKADYRYPMIRLPHTFSKLAGLPTRIYQTVHDGALAFLVVVSSSNKSEEESQKKSENAKLSVKFARLDMAEVAGSNPAEPICFLGCFYEMRALGSFLILSCEKK